MLTPERWRAAPGADYRPERKNDLNMTHTRKGKTKGQPDGVRRAIIYLRNLKGLAFLPYFFMVVATFAQLAVPAMVRRVIDAITTGVTSKMLLDALPKLPAQFMDERFAQDPFLSEPSQRLERGTANRIPGSNRGKGSQRSSDRRNIDRCLCRGTWIVCLPAKLLGGTELTINGF